MISSRFKNAEKVGMGSYFDWLLLGIIGVIGLSGTLAWLTRVSGIAGLAYLIYFIHLVFVLALFIYLPYSKLAHIFYRGAALTFNKYSGREAQAVALPASSVQEAAPAAESGDESGADKGETETKTK
jgi:quinone-modifying oxidoreductase subunit QmoC